MITDIYEIRYEADCYKVIHLLKSDIDALCSLYSKDFGSCSCYSVTYYGELSSLALVKWIND